MATKAKLSKSYLHVPRKTPFTGLTVGQQLYKSAEKFGNKEMYVFCGDNERISFQQMKNKVRMDITYRDNIYACTTCTTCT